MSTTSSIFMLENYNESIVENESLRINSTKSYNASDFPQIPTYIRITSMFFCITIMIFGVIGNIMVPIVIVKTKDMRNSTNIFLTNLSIADLLVLLICTPTVLVEVNTVPEIWLLGYKMCKAVPFIELTVAHASVLTILAISFERYYAICEPLKAGYVCTKSRALIICLLAWTVAALLTSPILWVAEYKLMEYIDGSSVAVCITQAVTVWAFGFFLLTIMVFFVLPLIVLIVLYGVIATKLIWTRGAILKIHTAKPDLSLKARRQVVLMLGAVVLSFFLCLLPFRLLTLWIILSSDNFWEIGVEKYYNVLYFSRIMWYLNSAINPILYNLMSTKFREGFSRLFKCWFNCLVRTVTVGCHRRGPFQIDHTTLNMTTTTATTTTLTTTTSSSAGAAAATGNTNTNKSALFNALPGSGAKRASGSSSEDILIEMKIEKQTQIQTDTDGSIAEEKAMLKWN